MTRPTGPCFALQTALQRIHSRCTLTENGCLIWGGGTDSKGYGMISFEGVSKYTHRLVFEAVHRDLQPGEVVRHTCDTPRCQEPSHLIPGSKGDNIRDAFARGRLKRKIPPETVKLLQSGALAIPDVVKACGVTASYAYNVQLGHKRKS